MQFKIIKPQSTTIFFDESTREPLVVQDKSNELRTNANKRNSQSRGDLVLSKPILQAGQIIIHNTPIPTMSQWGLFIFGLLILNLGVFGILEKERKFIQE